MLLDDVSELSEVVIRTSGWTNNCREKWRITDTERERNLPVWSRDRGFAVPCARTSSFYRETQVLPVCAWSRHCRHLEVLRLHHTKNCRLWERTIPYWPTGARPRGPEGWGSFSLSSIFCYLWLVAKNSSPSHERGQATVTAASLSVDQLYGTVCGLRTPRWTLSRTNSKTGKF